MKGLCYHLLDVECQIYLCSLHLHYCTASSTPLLYNVWVVVCKYILLDSMLSNSSVEYLGMIWRFRVSYYRFSPKGRQCKASCYCEQNLRKLQVRLFINTKVANISNKPIVFCILVRKGLWWLLNMLSDTLFAQQPHPIDNIYRPFIFLIKFQGSKLLNMAA